MMEETCDIREREALVEDWFSDDHWLTPDENRWHSQPSVQLDNARQRDELESTFLDLATRWRRETAYESSVSRMTSNPIYLDIVRLAFDFEKERVVALILRELKKHPHYWFTALEILTGQKFRQGDADFKRERRAWMNWGKARGYL